VGGDNRSSHLAVPISLNDGKHHRGRKKNSHVENQDRKTKGQPHMFPQKFTFASQIQSERLRLRSRMSQTPDDTLDIPPSKQGVWAGDETHMCSFNYSSQRPQNCRSSKLHKTDQRQQLELELTDCWLISDRYVVVQFHPLTPHNGREKVINMFFIKIKAF